MSYRKFGHNDVLYNTLRTHPEYKVHVYDSQVYVNNETARKGTGSEASRAWAQIKIDAQDDVDEDLFLTSPNNIVLESADGTTITVTVNPPQGLAHPNAGFTSRLNIINPSFAWEMPQADIQGRDIQGPEIRNARIAQRLAVCINASQHFQAYARQANGGNRNRRRRRNRRAASLGELNYWTVIIYQIQPGNSGNTNITLNFPNVDSMATHRPPIKVIRQFQGGHYPGGTSDYIKNIGAQGTINLHELNVDRGVQELIYPFVTRNSTRTAFKTISSDVYNIDDVFPRGEVIRGQYPLSASLSRIYVPAGPDLLYTTHENKHWDELIYPSQNKKYIRALKNTLDGYSYLSPAYQYSASCSPTTGECAWNKGEQEVNMICVPSIFYGSKIKKGSVKLNFYVSGTLAGQLADSKGNGELIQVSASTTNAPGETTYSTIGDVAGVVLYNEGIFLLTGSWALDPHTELYKGSANSAVKPSWLYFGAGMPTVEQLRSPTLSPPATNGPDAIGSGLIPKTSFDIEFQGTNEIPTLTMIATAKKGELSYSNNPTFIQSGSYGEDLYSATSYQELPRTIKNTVKSNFSSHSASFKRQTFISKIGIYDKHKNLIAIASLANPVKKTTNRDYIFKLKMDF